MRGGEEMKKLLILIFVLVIGTLITSSVPSAFAGGPLIHDHIADETAKKTPYIHVSSIDPSDKIFRNGAVLGDLGIAYYFIDPWPAPQLRDVMGSGAFTDKLFEFAQTDKERAWAAGMACHNKADFIWGSPREDFISYIREAGILKYPLGLRDIREWYFKTINDLAVKDSSDYQPELGDYYCYADLLVDAAYNSGMDIGALSARKVRWAAGMTMLSTSLYHKALGKVPYKLLVPNLDWTDLIVLLVPFMGWQIDHPCVTCAGRCWPWPCCDFKFTDDNWRKYVSRSRDGCLEEILDKYGDRPEVTLADFRPIVMDVKAEKSERPYLTYTEDLWPHVYAYTENIGKETESNVWTSYVFTATAEYPLAGECSLDFKGDVCWKQKQSPSKIQLIKDAENQYHCLGFMSQNWESGNNKMVGAKCTTYRKDDSWWGKMQRDSHDGEPGPTECTYLCFNKKTLQASECSGSFKGDICWKQKTAYKETGKEGDDPKYARLVKWDPENPYLCFGLMSQNWEKDNDDMVGLGCEIDYSYDFPYISGVLTKDWRRAESGPGQCTFLCISAKALGRYVEKPGVFIPGCLNGLFIYDNIIAKGPGSPDPKKLLNDPNERYQCLAFVTQNWDNYPPETKYKVKNDEFVGLKCIVERDGSKWMGKLQKGGEDSELELSECSFLCINKQWSKCYSDSSIPVGGKGETIRAFFPASPGTVTFGMHSDSKLLLKDHEDHIGDFDEQPYPEAEENNLAEYSFDWDNDFATTNIVVEPSRPFYDYTQAGDCVRINATFTSTNSNVSTHAKFYIDDVEIANVPVEFGPEQIEVTKEIIWLSDCAGDIEEIEKEIDGSVIIITGCGEHRVRSMINPFPESDNFGNLNRYVEKDVTNNIKEIPIQMVIDEFYVEEVADAITDIIGKPEPEITITDINEKQAEIANWMEMSKFEVASDTIDSGIVQLIFSEEGNTGEINIADEMAYCEATRDYSYNLSEAIMKMYVLEKKRWELENVVVDKSSEPCAYGKAHFTTIQDAIDSEVTNENNTVIVCPGIYQENVEVDKPLKIVGFDPLSTTVKAPNRDLPAFYVITSPVTIDSLTIEGPPDSESPGIYLSEVISGVIRNNIIQNNKIGIYLPDSSNNTITRNRIISNDYGVSCLSAAVTRPTNKPTCTTTPMPPSRYTNTPTSTPTYTPVTSPMYRATPMPSTGPNLIYDNFFNNTENYYSVLASNSWNTTKTELGYGERNIVGDYYLGGNYWAKPDGTGFSQTCDDLDGDGFCDQPYTLTADNIDYLPLKDCSCESCQDCMDKLNDPTCKFVKLSRSIHSTNGTCINEPSGFSGKVFDCKGHEIEGDGTGSGILLSNDNNTIKNCVISNFNDAIRLRYANLNVLKENTLVNNKEFGIHFTGSSENLITENSIENNWHGIDVYSSSQNNNITNNALDSNEVGIIDVLSGKNTITDNYVTNSSSDGILLYWNSDYSIVENNTVENSNRGITVKASRNCEIYGNALNSNDIGVALVPRSEAERTSDTMVERNQITNSGEKGIYLESTSFNKLIDNSIIDYQSGIYLKVSPNNSIVSNTVSCEEFTDYCELYPGAVERCRGNAIELWNSSLNNITGNLVSQNYDGIRLMDSSNHNVVLDNVVESSDHTGIRLNWESLNPVKYNNITNNAVHHNSEGISLYADDHGLCCRDYNSIQGNEIFNNQCGIKIRQSGSNEITSNIAHTNERGIYIEGTYCDPLDGGCSNSNTINNNIFDNSINAYDSGCDIWNILKTPGTNIIDSGPYLGGNYWSDYEGADLGWDGIGDTLLPYDCSGNITMGGDGLPLAPIEQYPWPMFRHDLMHTGRSPYIGPGIPACKWTYSAGHAIHSSPTIGPDGTIYVGSLDKKLHALNPDGSLKWAFPTEDWIYSSPAIGSDGTVYVGSDDNNLYAINPDGTLKWTFPTGYDVLSSPAIGPDGTVYVGSHDNNLYAINSDGSPKWTYPTGGWVYSSPAIAPDETIYVGSLDGKLHAVNPDGSPKWTYLAGYEIWSSPAIGADGTVYVGSRDNKLHAVNPDGTLRWAYLAGGHVRSSPAIGTDGTVYVGSLDSKLHAVNPDGTPKWTFLTGGSIYSSPAIGGDGAIYVGSEDNNLYALNLDGTLKWTYLTEDRVGSSPAIGEDGTIYIGSNDNRLHAIEMEYRIYLPLIMKNYPP
jgi:parallel beta-helix repeat protein